MDERTVLVINGPNLNLLGEREPEVYGHATLADLEDGCQVAAAALGLTADCRQSNHEGALVDRIQQALDDRIDGIVINPGAYTHTSVALRDALLAVSLPVVEVHLSNVAKREDFRQMSFISDIAVGTITGLGPLGYVFAVQALEARHA